MASVRSAATSKSWMRSCRRCPSRRGRSQTPSLTRPSRPRAQYRQVRSEYKPRFPHGRSDQKRGLRAVRFWAIPRCLLASLSEAQPTLSAPAQVGRLWIRDSMSACGVKLDIRLTCCDGLLLTQSGHQRPRADLRPHVGSIIELNQISSRSVRPIVNAARQPSPDPCVRSQLPYTPRRTQ